MANTKWITAAFFLLLIGLGISAYLVVHHYDLIYGLRETKSFCTISDKVDCDAVNASSFSEIGGISVAMIGLVAFAVQLILLIGMRALGEDEKPRVSRYFFYLTVGNVLFSVYLAVASVLILKTLCLFCAALYSVSLLLFVCGWKLINGSKFGMLADDGRALFRSQNGARGMLALLVAIPLGSAMGTGMYKQSFKGDIERLVSGAIADWSSASKFDFNIVGAPEAGNSGGSFVIVEFSDFECPHCKRAAPTLHAFVGSHKSDTRFIFQNYPLDGTCNPHVTGGGGHKNSCSLAKASLCANKQGKFWAAHDWIFAHQEMISGNSIDEMVKELGLDAGSFDTCIKSEEITSELAAQIERGHGAGLQGTPSVFVNGKLLPGGFLIPVLEEAHRSTK